MTADEVEEYINQIAFSGATDFIEKYKDKANDDQIIGHFGLGFYSAFMVADAGTRSIHYPTKTAQRLFTGPATAVLNLIWLTDTKEGVGTEITLFLNEDCR